MDYVFDSSSLIYLGKLQILEKLKLLEGKKIIPENVYKEVVIKGLKRNEPEAQYIDELVEKKIFIVKKPKSKIIEKIPFLSKADEEVLSLAQETKSIAIIDEIYANAIAETRGTEAHDSLYILFKLLEKKIITKTETIKLIDKMIGLGFYLSADVYRNILDKINEINKP